MQGEVVKAAQPLAERFIYDARIERAETKPDVRQRPEQLLEQIGERQTRRKVAAVGGDLDARQHDLVHACRTEASCLGKRLLRRQRAYPAARIWNDAVGAEVVAAILYFKEGTCASLRNAGRQRLIAAASLRQSRFSALHRRFTALNDLCAVLRAADDIDLAGRLYALRVDLRKAAARRDDRAGVVPAEPVERADIFMVGDRCDRAGVDDDRIRAAVYDLVSALGGKLRERLRLEQIDLAAERKESKFHAVLLFISLSKNCVFPTGFSSFLLLFIVAQTRERVKSAAVLGTAFRVIVTFL